MDILEWLIKIGRIRSFLAKMGVLLEKEGIMSMPTAPENLGEKLIYFALLTSRLGHGGARRLFMKLKRNANRRRKYVYEYLLAAKRRGNLDTELSSIGAGQNIINAVNSILNIGIKYGLFDIKIGLDISQMAKLYEDLLNARGLGPKISHYIIYELIRVYDFPCPSNLDAPAELKSKLSKLGIDPKKVKPGDWPYLDAAIHDLSV